MAVPYLTLTSDGGDVYNFPASFWYVANDWAKTSDIRNIAYADGGRNVGDNFLRARTITIEGVLYADSLTALETAERALINATLKGGTLTVSDDTVSRYIDVRFATSAETYIQEGNRFSKPKNITMIATYPLWEDSSLITDVNVLAGNGSFTVDNSGSDRLVLPVIEFVADQGSDLPSVQLRNQSDGLMEFEYVDASFIAGATLTVDSAAGTVKLNNSDTIENVTEARFLRLQNVNNTFLYEGNACTINVKFRKVYL